MSTVVAINAHPDDEALLMGGTLAALAAVGHRVILVVATDGLMNGTDEPNPRRRLDELEAAGTALGAADVRWLGYADSGLGTRLYPDPPGRVRLSAAGVDEPASRLAAIVKEESADLLIGYDAAGGYRHRDHLAVHAIAREAAARTGVRLVEATIPREFPVRLLAVTAALRLTPSALHRAAGRWFTPSREITHRIDVRSHVRSKQRALAAHRSEISKPGIEPMLMRIASGLPSFFVSPFAGREYFHEPGRSGRFASLL